MVDTEFLDGVKKLLMVSIIMGIIVVTAWGINHNVEVEDGCAKFRADGFKAKIVNKDLIKTCYIEIGNQSISSENIAHSEQQNTFDMIRLLQRGV